MDKDEIFSKHGFKKKKLDENIVIHEKNVGDILVQVVEEWEVNKKDKKLIFFAGDENKYLMILPDEIIYFSISEMDFERFKCKTELGEDYDKCWKEFIEYLKRKKSPAIYRTLDNINVAMFTETI